MNNRKNPRLTPLIFAAALSVIAFSGIGVAAITGHLSIRHSSINPFASFRSAPASGIIQALTVPADSHKGLTRNRGETLAEGKLVTFRSGAPVSARRAACPDCGVVDSIIPGHARRSATGTTHLADTGSEGETILKLAAGKAAAERVGLRTAGFVVTVHMENGTVRTIYDSERPPFAIGERVKLVNGSVIRLG